MSVPEGRAGVGIKRKEGPRYVQLMLRTPVNVFRVVRGKEEDVGGAFRANCLEVGKKVNYEGTMTRREVKSKRGVTDGSRVGRRTGARGVRSLGIIKRPAGPWTQTPSVKEKVEVHQARF